MRFILNWTLAIKTFTAINEENSLLFSIITLKLILPLIHPSTELCMACMKTSKIKTQGRCPKANRIVKNWFSRTDLHVSVVWSQIIEPLSSTLFSSFKVSREKRKFSHSSGAKLRGAWWGASDTVTSSGVISCVSFARRLTTYRSKHTGVEYISCYSVCASFAMAAKNSSSCADWVVKSSLSLHILILPCESPVATVWRLEERKKTDV